MGRHGIFIPSPNSSRPTAASRELNRRYGIPSMSESGKVMKELVAWSAELPPWQRDALRRLVVSGSLTEACLADLVAMACGVPDAPAPVPLDASHIGSAGTPGRTIALKAIRNLKGVNALADGQELGFATAGLSVIYGENGAGKSGYARVLKSACRAKDRGEVLGDVRAGSAPTSPPTAQIDFVVDGASHSINWQAGEVPDADLSVISVFDSSTASLRVDQANEVSYTPLPMRLLADLAAACAVVEARIKTEIAAVSARLPAWVSKPQCADGSSAMAELRRIGPHTDVDELFGRIMVSADENARREKLTTDLRSDPATLVKTLSRRASGLDRILEIITQAEEATALGRRKSLVAADQHAQSTRHAADVAATRLFGTASIQGIGSETWLHLWEAARRYSETAAYNGRRFPVVDDGSVCVLCVQPLDENARQRLTSFDEFVRADTQTSAERAEASRDVHFKEWRGQWPEVKALPRVERFLAEDCGLPQLGAEVRAYLGHVRWLLRRFQRTRELITSGAVVPTAALQRERDALKVEIGRLQSNQAEAHYLAMRRELDELDGRAWLASLRDDLVAEVSRRADEQRLVQALKGTNTRALSLKSKEISLALVTNALRDAFAAEVVALGIPDLRVELVDDGAKRGEPQFRLRLVAGTQVPLSRVLSEGEFRMAALAAFLAELHVAGDVCSIVFDDPVSSLDHRHRHAVARRLAQVAAKRQVIVFTHDLFFLFALEEASEEEALSPPHRQHICRSPIGERRPGIVDSELPLVAQKAEHAVNVIKQKLRKLAAASAGSPSEWEHHAKMLCNLMRLAWERALESVIGVVLRRFSPKFDFQRVRELAVIDSTDVAVARDGFDWCSRHMHNESLAAPRPVPTPEDIEHRLGQLLGWVTAVKAKQDRARKS